MAFTLIELLIVVTLIVVLAGIGLSTYATSVLRAKEAVLREDLFRMRDALDQYNADKGTYPQDLAALVSDGYMRQIPKDPMTDSTDTLAKCHVRAGSGQSKCSARRAGRQERINRDRHRRTTLRGVVKAGD